MNKKAGFLKKKRETRKENKIIKKIENAFDNHEFKMYLQFIVDNDNKQLACAEALSRWVNSSGNIIFPGEYIGLMEKSGLITRFDYYMFESVCKKLESWKNTDFRDLTISCNFTRITISEIDFVDRIKIIAEKYDFDRKNLLIEITEDAVERNIDVAMDNIMKIKQLGFSVALDDIGSGFTSLISLCKYPVDVMKVDRDLLLLTNDEIGKKLFFGLVDLAHELNLKVVCEGVETEEQNALVTESGCDYIQGWYYSKALPENNAEDFAKEYMSNSNV